MVALCLVVACSAQYGRRPSNVSSVHAYAMKWRTGPVGTFSWQLSDEYAYGNQRAQDKVTGHVDIAVLSVDAGGVGLLQMTFNIETTTSQSSSARSYVYQVQVDPSGKIRANPDGQYFNLLDTLNVLPMLPPGPIKVGGKWHDTYGAPNPAMQATRNFSVDGSYLRDEGSGQSRVAVFRARLFATYDESIDYARLFGPPPQGQPPHMTFRTSGTQSVDVTYSYDPASRTLARSVATTTLDGIQEDSDASNGKLLDRHSVVGIETVTFARTS